MGNKSLNKKYNKEKNNEINEEEKVIIKNLDEKRKQELINKYKINHLFFLLL